MKNKDALLKAIELLNSISHKSEFDSFIIKRICYILLGLYNGRVISLRDDIKRFADELPYAYNKEINNES